jgi:VWFA-related protein
LTTLLALPLYAQQPPAPSLTQADSSVTIKTDSSMVSLPLVVRDKHGNIITKLTKDDISITEDGKPQTIRYFDHDVDLPLTLGLLVDVSASQHDALEEERAASRSFLEQMLRPTDKAFVVEFAREVDLLCNPTGSRPALQAALAQLAPMAVVSKDNSGSGSGDSRAAQHAGTQLYDAVFLAADEVIKKEPNRKALILLTDGVDRGSLESIASAIEAAQRADTIVYAIYFEGEEHHDRGFGHDGGNGGGGNPGGGRSGGSWPGGGGGWPGSGGGWPGGGGHGGNSGPGSGQHPQGGETHSDGRKILERMTQETGGTLFQVSKKQTVAALYQQIEDELRNQYRVGYATPKHDGAGYHEVSVTPNDKKLAVQTRAGYYSDK